MPSINSKIIVSTAGSRKTTFIVEDALGNASNGNILLLTYTIENLKQIEDYLIQRNDAIPPNVTVQSWYSFLLSDCVRPYQNFVYDKARISAIFFQEGRSVPYIKKSNVERYFFSSDGRIFTDKIAEFACQCDAKSNGLVIDRLERIYDYIYIDEVQDLAGYDFDFLELLLTSKIAVTVVGDSRQATYFTNCSPKNSRFKGQNIVNLFKDWEQAGTCTIIERNECYRCNQIICDFADMLYPDMKKTKSMNTTRTGHDGLFMVRDDEFCDYMDRYSPQILRYSKKTDTFGLPAQNFGLSKGQNYDRVLIFPNGPIKAYLIDGDPTKLKSLTKSKFYVAMTRARYSVAFLFNDATCFGKICSLDDEVWQERGT